MELTNVPLFDQGRVCPIADTDNQVIVSEFGQRLRMRAREVKTKASRDSERAWMQSICWGDSSAGRPYGVPLVPHGLGQL